MIQHKTKDSEVRETKFSSGGWEFITFAGQTTWCGKRLMFPVSNNRRCWKHVTCKACLKHKPK